MLKKYGATVVLLCAALLPFQSVGVFAQEDKAISLYHYDPAELAPYELSNIEIAERAINEDRPGDRTIGATAREMLLLGSGIYEAAFAFAEPDVATMYGDPSRTRHLIGSAGLATVAYVAMAGQANLSDQDLYRRSVGFSMALGLAKEMTDDTGFNWGDLAFDFFGSNLGYFISRETLKDRRDQKREHICRNFADSAAKLLAQAETSEGREEIVVYYSKMYSYALYKQRHALERRIEQARDLTEFRKGVNSALGCLRPENKFRPEAEKLLALDAAAWQARRPRVYFSDAFREEAKAYYEALKAKPVGYWRGLFAGGLYQSLKDMRLDAVELRGYMAQAGFAEAEIAAAALP